MANQEQQQMIKEQEAKIKRPLTPEEIKTFLREAITPSEKIRSLQIGRKIRDLVLTEIGDTPTHYRVIKGALIYLLDVMQQTDEVLQDHFLINDFKERFDKMTELNLWERVEEYGSNEEKMLQSASNQEIPTTPEPTNPPTQE